MTLQARLDRIRSGFEEKAPSEVLDVMHRATEGLRESGLAERAVGEGDTAPGFTLEDSRGRTTSLEELRSRGAVVLTFFRGDW